MIPVRKGSQRLVHKNYRALGGKLVFEYAIEKAIESKCFDQIIINSEDLELSKYADKYNINFYHRDSALATSNATSDQVVNDVFINLQTQPNSVVWINTASPLSSVADVVDSFELFMSSDNTSMVSVRKTRGHLVYMKSPINFAYKSGFQRTQEMEHAIEYNYAIMGWKSSHLAELENGRLFNSDSLFYLSSLGSNFLLKNDEDFELIQKLIS